MLGLRGCRLGIAFPEITEMQVRAIFEAAVTVKNKGGDPHLEIMVPLIGSIEEMRNQAAIVRRVADEVFKEKGTKVDYMVGTMIELPRAALTADQIAEEAEFFSFGTNDLTQTTYGISRDDINNFLPAYLKDGIFKQDPFATLDQAGVGQLVKMATAKGRNTRPNLKVGICGEHGGDPESVKFCHKIGLNYVSCSPFRLLTARLAAAQAALQEKQTGPDLHTGTNADQATGTNSEGRSQRAAPFAAHGPPRAWTPRASRAKRIIRPRPIPTAFLTHSYILHLIREPSVPRNDFPPQDRCMAAFTFEGTKPKC